MNQLLTEFRQKKHKETRCIVCYRVKPEVRRMIEGALKEGHGAIAISDFLREKKMWEWSETPIRTHQRHVNVAKA